MPRLVVALLVGTATVAGLPAVTQAKTTKPTLSVDDADKTQVIPFHGSRKPDGTGFSIKATPFSKTLKAPHGAPRGDLVSEQKNHIRDSHITVTLKPNKTSGFHVNAEVDPKGASAGRYTTTLEFGGSGYANVLPVTLQATVRDSFGTAFLWAFGGWLVGALVRMLSERFGVTTPRRKKPTVSAWLFKHGGIVVIVVGLVAGIAALLVSYLPNDVWGADDWDELKLAGTCLAAVVTGTTVGDIVAGLSGASPPAAA